MKSIGHTELLDFGLVFSKENADTDENADFVVYAEQEFSNVTHYKRVTDGLQLMYDFTEGRGNKVFDKSNSENSVDLIINDPLVTKWLPGKGLIVDDNTTIFSQQLPNGFLGSISSSNDQHFFGIWMDTQRNMDNHFMIAKFICFG